MALSSRLLWEFGIRGRFASFPSGPSSGQAGQRVTFTPQRDGAIEVSVENIGGVAGVNLTTEPLHVQLQPMQMAMVAVASNQQQLGCPWGFCFSGPLRIRSTLTGSDIGGLAAVVVDYRAPGGLVCSSSS